jgi:hypothetical protein
MGISKKQLLFMYNEATNKKFVAMIINLDKSGDERYR